MTTKEYYDLLDAVNMAWKAHEGQFRKDGITPYIMHPLFVMLHCESYKAKIVAVLHDTLEDTALIPDEIKKRFGAEILEAVTLLTKKPKEHYKDYIDKLSNNELAKEVKIADIEHNLANMDSIKNDKEREYLKKKYNLAMIQLKTTSGTNQQ